MKKKLFFPINMYTNIYGSVVLSALINHIYNEAVSGEKTLNIKELKKKAKDKWNQILSDEKERLKITWDFSDKDFYKKTLEFFDIPLPSPLNICVCMTKENVLYAPFIADNVIPLREDGIMARSMLKGKIYPVNFENTEELKNA